MHLGVIKSWDASKGFGFIFDDQDTDFFSIRMISTSLLNPL
jgi:cold shock CspA family protein